MLKGQAGVQYLQIIALALRECKRQAAFYLAAAVSDFYIPWSKLAGSSSDYVLKTYHIVQ